MVHFTKIVQYFENACDMCHKIFNIHINIGVAKTKVFYFKDFPS